MLTSYVLRQGFPTLTVGIQQKLQGASRHFQRYGSGSTIASPITKTAASPIPAGSQRDLLMSKAMMMEPSA